LISTSTVFKISTDFFYQNIEVNQNHFINKLKFIKRPQ
jgi:hypothetical protein